MHFNYDLKGRKGREALRLGLIGSHDREAHMIHLVVVDRKRRIQRLVRFETAYFEKGTFHFLVMELKQISASAYIPKNLPIRRVGRGVVRRIMTKKKV